MRNFFLKLKAPNNTAFHRNGGVVTLRYPEGFRRRTAHLDAEILRGTSG
jgi:hypothetical protein